MNSTIKPNTIRVNENLEAQTNEILDSIGVNCNNFVVMATHQLVNQNVFFMKLSPQWNQQTKKRQALVAAKDKILEYIPADAAGFNDVDELMAFLVKK